VRLRLDANRAWGFEAAAEFARLVEGTGYEYVEEPLADPAGLARLARDRGVPVALDESLVGMEPGELERHRYARAVVIKPTLLGGISHALQLADRATELGMTPVVSAAYETVVGMLALVALAAGIGGGAVPAGLDTYRQFAADVLRPPLDLSAPVLDVRQLLGIRREVVRDYLSPHRIT
jgi:O-succinylbenzoate synthase